MPRTTLNLDASVLAELKRRAKKQGRTLGEVASEQLECAFKEERPARAWPPEGWIVRSMGKPAIPIEDKAAIWELLDREAGLIP